MVESNTEEETEVYPSREDLPLHQKILRIICSKQNVTYKTLIEETRRDRTTILQSVKSLVKKEYIIKEKRNPEYEKSKLIFKPTRYGKNYALCGLGVDVEDVLKLERDEQIANYLELIKDIADPLQRKPFIEPLLGLFSSDVTTPQIKKQILNRALKKGVIEIVRNNNYDSKRLLNKSSIPVAQKIIFFKGD